MRAQSIALHAILAAVVCVATLIIRIPVPATSGYINLGDSAVLLFAILLGSTTGGIVGGMGSAMADILGGYPNWALLTLLIKGLEGFVAGKLGFRKSFKVRIVAVIAGGVLMVLGYFLAGSAIYGMPAAMTEIPGNLFQAGSGIVVSVALTKVLEKTVSDYLEAWK
jgi:uncharacterized membrane protein